MHNFTCFNLSNKDGSGVMAEDIKIGVVPSATPTFFCPWSMMSPLNEGLWLQCDSMHSLIERRIIGDIHTPRDYVVVFETARMHPSPYKVTQLYHNDFMKLPGANIRPGK